MTDAPALGRTAIVAGRGALPAAVVAAMAERPLICCLDGFQPDGLQVDHSFRLECLNVFLQYLKVTGVTRVLFAGGVQRPRLDPAVIDPGMTPLLPQIMAALQSGDDAALRTVIAIFEDHGFIVVGADHLAPGLVPGPGILIGTITETDRRDAARAAEIVASLGSVDVGQGAVIQQGLCLAVEALPGTDAMLDQVATFPPGLRPDPAKGRGLLYKAPKPGQDRRIDLPTLGPETVTRTARAGLGGLVWEAGGAILLDRAKMEEDATRRGLFLWARQP